MPDQEPSPFLFDYKKFLATLSTRPGVYRMIDQAKVVIYVGKAKNLKNRVSSYFRDNQLAIKTEVMIKQVIKIDVTITNTESEALLLENNLIKSLKPRYNILLRDDKSYPYIYLSTEDKFPRLAKHRGAKKLPGRYFGPYPNANSVKQSLHLLQKVFPIRQCEDSVFKNRTRACLQYQIKRCSGPCVGLVEEKRYQEDSQNVILFLTGKSGLLIDQLVSKMEQASSEQDYELASIYRDQIINLRRVQERQYISNEKGDTDVIAISRVAQQACIQLFFIRDGLNLGNKSFFPKHSSNSDLSEILNAFISQYYLNSISSDRHLPEYILVNVDIDDKDILLSILQDHSGRKIQLLSNVRGERSKWLKMAEENANIALQSRLSQKSKFLAQFKSLQKTLQFTNTPQRIECFDISHSSGEATVASCVVFNQEGALKSDYRRFNIEGITAGDDYAAMEQALSRRYNNAKKQLTSNPLPDVLLIDGGKGQVSQAVQVLQKFNINTVQIMGITKGEGRRAELDTLFIPNFPLNTSLNPLLSQQGKVILKSDSPALHLIQQLRDEAHRFAISAHRNKRAKTRQQSELENITGLGQKRRQLLLKQFGGIQEIKRAGIDDLSSIKGISTTMATDIYNHFHE